ncbi:MAG: hypothetical protein KC442_14055 [Thermomicrobiales bacterium]|nr:hypothetical protein [Thermomicrobiales bacterium]
MRKAIVTFAAVALGLSSWVGGTQAQDSQIDAAFSNEIMSTLGYPELTINVGPDGVDAPERVAAGLHLVTLSAPEPYVAYLNIVETPGGLTDEELVAQALAAGRNDMPQEGWTYLGGTNLGNPGEPVSFIIDLEPGDYHLAASYYEADADSEAMSVVPLTVTDAVGDASSAPTATVNLEETDDMQYVLTPETLESGPQLWKIENTGAEMAHHVVMVRVPEGATAPEIITEFNGMMAGTPPAGDSAFAQAIWVGYAAMQSGGQTIWSEFDLDPGTYAVICFILDHETGRPHAVDGMVTVFTVA